MKKILKVFSVLALLCCCMFSFAGCDMFKKEEGANDYASLVAERKIVREVVNNTKAFLQSNLEQETEPVTTAGVGGGARAVEDPDSLLDNCMRITEYYFSLIDAIINSSDFVPGKLYNAEIVDDADGEEVTYFFLMNAYCDGDDKVTLNFNFVLDSKEAEMYSTDSALMAYDIYYNDNNQPIRTVEYECSYWSGTNKDLTYNEIKFSETGNAVTFYQSTLQTGATGTRKAITIEDENGLLEYDESEFTTEMTTAFATEMESVKEKTYLFNFARPLSKEAMDELLDAFNRGN